MSLIGEMNTELKFPTLNDREDLQQNTVNLSLIESVTVNNSEFSSPQGRTFVIYYWATKTAFKVWLEFQGR